MLFGCQAAARHMVPRGRGAIVNIVSAAIDFAAVGDGVYAMSKVATAQLTRTLATELGTFGVRVNSVAPGFTVTAMTSDHFAMTSDHFADADGRIDEERRAVVLEGHRNASPLRSVCEPTDVSDAVYLASDASRFVTGQVLRVNGGIAMPL